MQVDDQEVPVLNRLFELEQQIGDLAVPAAETTIVRAFGPKGEVFYAVQPYRYTSKPLDYFAVRLRKLGHIRYIGNRERPMYVSTMVLSEKYSAIENSVHAIVNVSKRMVSIGPKGNQGITDPEDQGLGLGSFALSLMIQWLKLHYPNFRVAKCTLNETESSPDDRERRDRCLANVGFSVVYTNQQGKGYFYANSVTELREHINTKKIEEIGIDGLFGTFASMQEWHKELSNEFDTARKSNERLEEVEIPHLRRRIKVIGASMFMAGSIAGAIGAFFYLMQS